MRDEEIRKEDEQQETKPEEVEGLRVKTGIKAGGDQPPPGASSPEEPIIPPG